MRAVLFSFNSRESTVTIYEFCCEGFLLEEVEL